MRDLCQRQTAPKSNPALTLAAGLETGFTQLEHLIHRP
jgi:hypothetical protein